MARRAPAPRVDRTGGECGGRPAGPADAAVRRPCRTIVAGRGDDERVERRGSRRGGGERAVREGGERLHHADERHPRRVVGIPVLVRIDRELDPGQQLVGPAVDGDTTARVRLPAGDPDRQQRRARGDTLEAGRAARADDEARHLGAVALGPAGSRRVLTGAGVPAGIEDVEPSQERSADVRVDDVDTRVEQRDRDARARVPGNGDTGAPPTGDVVVSAPLGSTAAGIAALTGKTPRTSGSRTTMARLRASSGVANPLNIR